MQTINIKLDQDAIAPSRAYFSDAGLDLYATHRGVIPPHGSLTFDTGVHVQIPDGFCGLLVSKSGLNVNDSMTSTGLIDSSYTGSIHIKLYNHSSDTRIIEKSQKISQLVILPYLLVELNIVDALPETERGDNGFGSSGKF